jgi:hypothetical protein
MMKRYFIINVLLLPIYITTIVAGTMGLSTIETKQALLTVGLIPVVFMSILISGLMNGLIYLGQSKHGDPIENKRFFRTCSSIVAILYFLGLLITTLSMY